MTTHTRQSASARDDTLAPGRTSRPLLAPVATVVVARFLVLS